MKKRIILASQSPRRKKLLEQINLTFDIIPSTADEIIDNSLTPEEVCMSLSIQKAEDIESKIQDNAIIIGADTIVVYNDIILGKPADEEQAYDMLKMLSGNTHKVFTGVAIIDSYAGKKKKMYKMTEVTFRNLKDKEIKDYIKSGSPMDKAGAYGIQDDFGAVFISNINGCYYNVVGLPLEMLYSELELS